jgi:5'-nucleotidase
VTLTLTGDEIDTLLETQWQGAGSKLQASAGLQYRWSDGAAAGSKIAPGDILLDGRPLSPAGLYRVTVNSFMADGGDGYAVLKNGRDRVPGVLDVEALERYLGSQSPVSPPPPGRIVKLP